MRVAPERAFEAFVRVSEVLAWLADGAVLGVLGTEHDRFNPGALDRGDHLLAPGLGEVVWEESAVADDES